MEVSRASNMSTVFNYLSEESNFHNGYWIEQLCEFEVGEYESVPDTILNAYETLSSYEKCELVRRLAVEGKRQTR